MPSPIMNSAAKLMCAHGVQVTLIPKQFPMVGMSPKVLVGGKPVLLAGINGITSGIPPSPLIVAFPGRTKALGYVGLDDYDVTRELGRGSLSPYEYFEDRGVPYIATELGEGGSLRPLLGEPSLPKVAWVLEDLLSAVDHAGRNGIVHQYMSREQALARDIGPASDLSPVSVALWVKRMTERTPTTASPTRAALGRRSRKPCSSSSIRSGAAMRPSRPRSRSTCPTSPPRAPRHCGRASRRRPPTRSSR